MIRTVEAIIEADGSVKLLESMRLEKPHKALVTILEETELSVGWATSL